MDLEQLTIFLPCQRLEDLSLRRPADEAEQLLSGYSALWHPALLNTAGKLPSWLSAEDPPCEPAGHLILVPDCSVGLLPEGWLEQAAGQQASVVRGWTGRDELVATLLAQLGRPVAVLDPELVGDFLALGFCQFLVELLTRQLQYMSNLDTETLLSETLAAVEETFGGNVEAARERLQTAFDLLHEAREYFYPVDARLLDLTLVAPTTMGESLRAELAGPLPTNCLISGKLVRQMAREEPDTRRALADALRDNTAGILGGELLEVPLPLLAPEAIRYHIERGLAAYAEVLDARPTVFGRRRFGLTPVLPQILRRLGFTAAMHCTLDDGRFPVGNQSRVQWAGIDGSTLDAVARVPVDVSHGDAFLRFPERLGNSMDLDHVATVLLAHWPGHASPWYRDFARIAAYSPVFGTFATINDYFDETAAAGPETRYEADQYRSPYLVQDAAAGRGDPISRWARYYRRRAIVDAAQTLGTLASLIAHGPTEQRDLVADVEGTLLAEPDPADDLDGRLETNLADAVARFAGALAGGNRSDEIGCLVVNPWSFPRRVCIEMSEPDQTPIVAGPVRAVAGRSVVVDVPAMGFAWVGPASVTEKPAEPPAAKARRHRKKAKDELPLAEQRDDETVLRNEFFEIVIDPHTGAIRSISDYYNRGVRLAQQIALRTPQRRGVEPGDEANYSIMVADEVIVSRSDPMLGEVLCRGRLVDRHARRLAGFTQTTCVRRGNRIIELQIELDVDRQPGPDPWQSYYAARFAWADATSNLYRSVNMANVPTDCVQLETPHFVDVRSGRVRTTFLTGGLPYHRRFGLRKLDTLLVVRGETARRFRLGIGIDVPKAMTAALDFLAPVSLLPATCCPAANCGWLFHLDQRNVVATHWEPFSHRRHDGVDGFRVRLLESDGRKVRLGLRSFRSMASARKLHDEATPPSELPIDGDRIAIELGPYEWAEVEARFAT